MMHKKYMKIYSNLEHACAQLLEKIHMFITVAINSNQKNLSSLLGYILHSRKRILTKLHSVIYRFRLRQKLWELVIWWAGTLICFFSLLTAFSPVSSSTPFGYGVYNLNVQRHAEEFSWWRGNKHIKPFPISYMLNCGNKVFSPCFIISTSQMSKSLRDNLKAIFAIFARDRYYFLCNVYLSHFCVQFYHLKWPNSFVVALQDNLLTCQFIITANKHIVYG